MDKGKWIDCFPVLTYLRGSKVDDSLVLYTAPRACSGSASAKIEELKNAPRTSGDAGMTTSGEDKQDEAVDQDPSTWATGGESATQKQRAYSQSYLIFTPIRLFTH